jgi:NADPH-dependent 2,4-dienoyl-CoA reductase/sulfur reductase-like enzyme
MAEPSHGTVIVGASVAGLHAAERLRAHGYRDRIDVIDVETRQPYDRPPLSKGVLLGKAAHDDIRLPADGVELHLGVPATELREHTGHRTVHLADGREFTGSHVVLATGLSSRTLPGQPQGVGSVRTLRSLDDALGLRERMLAGASIAIIGAGLIGCEVASAGRDLGLDVTVVEALPTPMASALGVRAGQLFARLLRDRGVRLLAGVNVQTIDADDDRAEVTLGDGTVIAADTVLVAIGSVLNTGWLGPLAAGQAGLICDDTGQVHGHDGVFAVGDIASWPDPATGGHRRREHWMSARTQAAAVAARICGQPPAPPKPDYAWTDQFGLLIQILGRPELADTTVPLEEKVLGYFARDHIVGALIVGAPRRKGLYNRLIAAAAPITQFPGAPGPAEPFR